MTVLRSRASPSSYTVTSADLNKLLTLRVTGSKPGYSSTPVTSNGITGLPLPSLTTAAPAAITGSGEVGTALQGTPPTWDQPGVTSVFQWLRDGVAIPAQTALTYTVTATDIGKVLSLRVTGSKSGYSDTVVTSNGIAGVPQPSLVTSAPAAISGSGQVGSTLQGTAPTWVQGGVAATYQWLRDGTAIAGQTGPTYAVTATDLDRVLSLRVTGSKSGWSDTVVTSNGIQATAGPAPVATVAPSITGHPVWAARSPRSRDPGPTRRPSGTSGVATVPPSPAPPGRATRSPRWTSRSRSPCWSRRRRPGA